MNKPKCFCYLIPEINKRIQALEDPQEYCRYREQMLVERDEYIAVKAAALLYETNELKYEFEKLSNNQIIYEYNSKIEVLQMKKTRFDDFFYVLYDHAREVFVDLPPMPRKDDEQIISSMELLCAALTSVDASP